MRCRKNGVFRKVHFIEATGNSREEIIRDMAFRIARLLP